MTRKQVALPLALVACLVLALAGCDQGGSRLPYVPGEDRVSPSFETSIPYDGQTQVPLSAEVMVFFNEPLDPATLDSGAFVLEVERTDGSYEVVEATATVLTQGVRLRPAQLFVGSTNYRVRLVGGLKTFSGESFALPSRTALANFSTRSDRPQVGKAPKLVSVSPPPERARDFSTFHLYFDEPLDRGSVVPGFTVLMREAETGDVVDCRVLRKFTVIALDPLEDLTPGVEYEIVVTTGVRDMDGTPIEEEVAFSFTPTSTRPLHGLVVEACPTAGPLSSSCDAVDSDDLPISALTGRQVNSMITIGKVLGESRTYLSGPLFTELGNSGRETADLIPVVLRAGQTLNATNLAALLGGEIPTGLETGDIAVTLLTDATGFIEDATGETDALGLRPRVKLTMDASLNAADPQANAAFSQEILGIELSGYSEVDPDTGVMRMELGGNAEVWIMGERVASVMTMYQVAPDVFPEPVPDTDPPVVATVTPIDGEELVNTETPIVVNLDEPINPDTPQFAFSLTDESGADVEGDLTVEGGKIVFRPALPLSPRQTFTVSLSDSIYDLAGNQIASPFASTFTTNAAGYDRETGPRIGTTFPATEYGATFPRNLEPIVFFAGDIDPATVIYGETVSFIDIDSGQLVDASLEVDWRQITFHPAQYLTEGRRYRIEIKSEVLSLGGVRVDTDDDFNPGGGAFQLDFVAEPYLDVVPLILHSGPEADRNANGYFDDEESETPLNQIAILSILFDEVSYVRGDLISVVHGLSKTADGEVYLDVDLSAGIRLFATSAALDLDALLDFLENFFEFDDAGAVFDPFDLLELGPITIDVIRQGSAPIAYNEFDFVAEMSVLMDTYFSMTNGLLNALITHELPLDQTGQLTFIEDGRMQVIITGQADIDMLGLIALPSMVTMRALSAPSL